jgi:hypothetical protein
MGNAHSPLCVAMNDERFLLERRRSKERMQSAIRSEKGG